MTKADERKALEQIRKIVEGLGADSYIGTAFEGCFEIAKQNIDNDWACSMKQRAEGAEKNTAEFALKLAETQREVEKVRKAYEQKEKYAEALNNALNASVAKANKIELGCRETESNLNEAKNEIIHLKAKLYDLMTK